MKDKYSKIESPFSHLLWMYALSLEELNKEPNFSILHGLLCEVSELLRSDYFTEKASAEEKEDLEAIEHEIFNVPTKAPSRDLPFVRQALTNLGKKDLGSDLKLWTSGFENFDIKMKWQFKDFLREFAHASGRELPIEEFPRFSTIGGFIHYIEEHYPLPTPEKP